MVYLHLKHLLSTYPFQVIFQQQHAQVHHIHRVMLDLDYVLFENNLENKTIFQPSIFVGFSISWKSLVNLSKETKFNKCYKTWWGGEDMYVHT